MSRIGLAVDPDGRSRTMVSPFRAKSGRNQPSTSRFIFGAAAWLRSLIMPKPGRAVFYMDYSQQEFGIAAALSGDVAMAKAYRSGDPYLAFAKQAGAVPKDATKDSHPNERKLFKQCSLAVLYGQGAESFARRIGATMNEAQRLLRLHRETYKTFWVWSDRVVTYAMLHGVLFTRFNWRMQVGPTAREPSLRNFPMQANGAEMLRVACILGTENGIRICAPVHDAVLVECGIDEVDECVDRMRACMRIASEIVCPGFPLDTDVEIVRYPERYEDERGAAMWRQVSDLLQSVKEGHHAIAS
jgi:DNA polymerase I-like protein with 3'-5' exonuclease and polymerase domains